MNQSATYRPFPPQHATLAPGEVHVWQAQLDLPLEQVQALRRVLSADELQRAGSFYFERDRQRFIAGRGCLRYILARYIGVAPADLCFCYGSNGKPQLEPIPGAKPLWFSVSHSRSQALYAVTAEAQVGIDVEYVNSELDWHALARHVLSPMEHATIYQLPAEARRKAFFACWTRKEAYIKGRGEGLSHPLGQFSVTVDPVNPPRLLHSAVAPGDVQAWALHQIDLDSEFQATLAVQAPGCKVRHWHYSPVPASGAAVPVAV